MTNAEDWACGIGDIMKVKVSGFTSRYACPGDVLLVSFYKNDILVCYVSASCGTENNTKTYHNLYVVVIH